MTAPVRNTHAHAIPFLKWAGGKRWLAPAIAGLFGVGGDRIYVEPFLGSGAVFFALSPRRAQLSDINAELVNAFRIAGRKPSDVIEHLNALEVSKEIFDAIRKNAQGSVLNRAVRFIYLNRTAFNGLYRVNNAGEFNVPFGCKPETTPCDAPTLTACAPIIRRAHLRACDFRQALETVEPSALVYLDPPYSVAHNRNGFLRYNETLFSWTDQQALAHWANTFAGAGGAIIASNAAAPAVRKLYDRERFTTALIARNSRMAADVSARGVQQELLFVSRATAPAEQVRLQLEAAGVKVIRVLPARV